jgi:hypothetical protein
MAPDQGLSGTLELDMSPELTLGQLEDIEQALGYPMSEATDPGRSQLRLARAMIYVRRKRLDPTYTFDDTYDLPPSAMVQFAQAMAAMEQAAQSPPQSP